MRITQRLPRQRLTRTWCRYAGFRASATTPLTPGYDAPGAPPSPPVPLLGWFARVNAPATGPLTSSPLDFSDTRDRPRYEFGVFGIVSPGRDVARMAYFALYALQHRGQES